MALKDSLVNYVNAVRGAFRSPFNAMGELVTYRNGELVGRPVVVPVGIVESDAELTFQKEQKESFSDVFDSWMRFARTSNTTYNTTGDPYHDEAYPAELDTWSYDAVEDRVVCTIKSASMVGFISNERYDKYTLEARIKSSNNDDDYIGLVIAHAKDSQGRSHTLDVMRSLMGQAPMQIIKDRSVNPYIVEDVYDGLIWPDGSVATGAFPGNQNSAAYGWGNWPNGILLKITREGDVVTVETSQINETTYYAPATTTIDLSSDPELTVFRGPQRYGYTCQSQPSSTWDVLQRAGDRLPIVDIRTYDWHAYENGEWVLKGTGLTTLLENNILVSGSLHYNPVTRTFFYITDDEQTIKLQRG